MVDTVVIKIDPFTLGVITGFIGTWVFLFVLAFLQALKARKASKVMENEG